MSELDNQIKLKTQRVQELAKLIKLNMDNTKFTKDIGIKVNEAKERMEFRLKNLEIQGLDEKIKVYETVLKLVKENGVQLIQQK
jgi:hypothetical protein